MSSFNLARNDFASYAMLMCPPYVPALPHRLLINRLESLERGESSRLVTVWPPQHGKSLTAGLFTSWYLGRNPAHNIVLASYSQDLAEVQGRRIRNYVDSELHQAIFPESKLSADSSSIARFDTSAGGSFTAVGRGAGLTGRSADLLLLDDLVKDRIEADSQTIRDATLAWYREAALTRLTVTGKIVALGTRWHQSDLLSNLVNDPAWTKLILPAIAVEHDEFRHEGEALWPEVRSLAWLQAQRAQMGSAAFQALYQCDPVAAGGALFLRSWWQEYARPPATNFVCIAVDTAFKTGKDNDFSAITVWGTATENFYVLDAWRGRVLLPELCRRLDQLADQWRPSVIVIEDIGRGVDLAEEFRQKSPWPIKKTFPHKDKVTRAQAVLPLFEAGKVFLPREANWRADYIDELSAFPHGAHDDWVDCSTMALSYLRDLRKCTWGAYDLTTGQPIAPTPWWEKNLEEVLRESQQERERQWVSTFIRAWLNGRNGGGRTVRWICSPGRTPNFGVANEESKNTRPLTCTIKST